MIKQWRRNHQTQKVHNYSSQKTQRTAGQGTWTRINNLPATGTPDNPAVMYFPSLMTDGTVLFTNTGFNSNTSEIWKLTPDIYGGYVNGTWSRLADLPIIDGEPYQPYPMAKAVLPDGRLIFAGGEYNGPNYDFELTNKSAIYDPVTNTWTPIAPPSFFTNEFPFPAFGPPEAFNPHPIGDVTSAVLPDGRFMLGGRNCFVSALLDPDTLTWTETGFNKNPQSPNFNEGWALLPNGKIITANRYVGPWLHFGEPNVYPPGNNNTTSEIYDPATGNWSSGGNTVAQLQEVPPLLPPIDYTDEGLVIFGLTYEDGPTIVRPDGTVVVCGVNGKMAIYDSKTETWSEGPRLPVDPDLGQLGYLDSAAQLLPNGNVLLSCDAPTQHFSVPPTFFFELTKDNKLVPQTQPEFALDLPSEAFAMLMLPNGDVLLTNLDNTVIQFYTPADKSYDPSWAPVIKSAPRKVRAGKTYKICGIRFNGMSQAGDTSDDSQYATNYPLVRITNSKTGHVFYCRTHDHSFMGIASDRHVHTFFDVPSNIESGCSKLEVVANGIPSKPVHVCVKTNKHCH